MTLLPRRPRRAWSALAVLVLLVLAATPAGADPVQASDLYPDPTGDAFLDLKFPTRATAAPHTDGVLDDLPNSTILASRAITVTAPLKLTATFQAWQAWFRTTAADGAPEASVTTILKPIDWNGRVVADNYAIDSLGLKCNPSYEFVHGLVLEIPDITRQLLWRGYAVVVTDYQGPKMAYAHGPTMGREVLDGLRAALHFPPAGLDGSPAAMIGYSGGATATVWAAQLQPQYAPDLVLRGAAAGGTPADLSLTRATMDGRYSASVLYLMAVVGVARVTPGALDLANDLGAAGLRLIKNFCVDAAPLGLIPEPVPLSLSLFTKVDPYETPIAKQILRETRAGGLIPTMPIYLWHGRFDQWIPVEGAETLAREWVAGGASVVLNEFPCEHFTCAALPAGLDQIDRWLGRTV
ncbi:lipase family protein [Nocardia arthritidis]|uniref:Lipase n=1 Tax=Nocardia arthritidis TaxID=228602 RepID=A0A6G9YGU5_9NOCA|nr:lipase family protein [Nocardia arthritidis]QIS12276.1 hypothetical protein F5544_22070 [Nocardia arthritidis]